MPAAIQAAAAAWVVRLQAPEADEAEWLTFEAWLVGEPDARPAFDLAMATWLAASRLEDDITTNDQRRRGAAKRRGSRFGERRLGGMAALGFGGLGIAITAGLVIVSRPALVNTTRPTAAAGTVYATTAGERRTVTLADGTRLDLSGGSRVSVSLDAHTRQVAMAGGEVAFIVAHDPARPFSVTIGDRRVRDIGTAFDVARSGPQIRVTVKQGEVAVAAIDDASTPPTPLSAGHQLVHDEDTGASSVRSVPPSEAFAWKQGRLIYRDQPLRVVVEDLNRYFPRAVRIEDERVGAMRFTGVLTVDGKEATLRRLAALMPIQVDHVGDDMVLRARIEAP
ncbi:MAG TPA: FecR domain-containing protein [Caulobacteraceae bacterium]|nr:FecR domain-containing protein [Caulobacteraceae bacterium]